MNLHVVVLTLIIGIISSIIATYIIRAIDKLLHNKNDRHAE